MGHGCKELERNERMLQMVFQRFHEVQDAVWCGNKFGRCHLGFFEWKIRW